MKRITIFITLLTLLFALSSPSAFAADKLKDAEKLYKQALTLSDKNKPAAIKLMDKAILLNPNNPEYYYSRGRLYVLSNHNDAKSIPDFDRAVVLNPTKYFNLCYGGPTNDASCVTNYFHGLRVNTQKWDSYTPTTADDIKAYLSTYKGKTADRVKNASTIMDTVTKGEYVFLIAKSPDQKATATFEFLLDRPNEIPTLESLATSTNKAFLKDPAISNVSDIKPGKIGNMDVVYFDYDYAYTTDNVVTKNRIYMVLYNYYALVIYVEGDDQAQLDAAINDFINKID